jgi:hypothetical protein
MERVWLPVDHLDVVHGMHRDNGRPLHPAEITLFIHVHIPRMLPFAFSDWMP